MLWHTPEPHAIHPTHLKPAKSVPRTGGFPSRPCGPSELKSFRTFRSSWQIVARWTASRVRLIAKPCLKDHWLADPQRGIAIYGRVMSCRWMSRGQCPNSLSSGQVARKQTKFWWSKRQELKRSTMPTTVSCWKLKGWAKTSRLEGRTKLLAEACFKLNVKTMKVWLASIVEA